MPEAERYSMAQAQHLLQTSKSALHVWIKRAGLVEVISRQRYPDDLREHWLSREQVELLAGQHRRVLQETPAPDLSERVEALEARVEALEQERKQESTQPDRPASQFKTRPASRS